jgi:PAS domain S-box-containing protein
VVFFRYQEFRQTQKGRLYINVISQTTTQKLKFLIGMNKAMGYIEVSLLRHIYTSDSNELAAQHQIIRSQNAVYNLDFLSYEKLDKIQGEQEIFNQVKLLKNDNDKARDTLLFMSDAGTNVFDKRMQEAILRQQDIYEKFQEANARLSNFVSAQSKNEIANVNNYIFKISKRREVSSYIVIFLLLVLALAIANAILKIKEMNKALAQSKIKYRRFVQNTGEIIIRSDGYGKILFTNRAFREKMGYSTNEIAKLNISDLFADETESIDGNSVFFRQEEQITSVNVIYKTKHGKRVYLEGNVVLKYKDGRLEITESFLRDITQRKQLHDKLSASENKYKALFDLSPLPKYFVDTDTLQFVEVNPAAVKKYGYSREEFLNMTIYNLRRLGMEESEAFEAWILPFKRIGSSFETKTRHYKKSGRQMEVELRFKTVELMGKHMFLVVAIDVTKKERRERELNQAILKAQENERREIGAELHDNICQILASSHLLLDSAKRMEGSERNYLIEESKKHITRALTEIRNLSHRMAPIIFEVSSFKEAITELLLNMNPHDDYEIEFDYDEKIDVKPLLPDIQLNLYRILQEQLKNIIKYAEATSIQLEILLYDDMIRMQITDNGVGFEKGKVNKGIGTLNMQRRAELFSGKFSIEAAPGKGCSVLVELPLSPNDVRKN